MFSLSFVSVFPSLLPHNFFLHSLLPSRFPSLFLLLMHVVYFLLSCFLQFMFPTLLHVSFVIPSFHPCMSPSSFLPCILLTFHVSFSAFQVSFLSSLHISFNSCFFFRLFPSFLLSSNVTSFFTSFHVSFSFFCHVVHFLLSCFL